MAVEEGQAPFPADPSLISHRTLRSTALGTVLDPLRLVNIDLIPRLTFSKNLVLDENGTAVAKDKWYVPRCLTAG